MNGQLQPSNFSIPARFPDDEVIGTPHGIVFIGTDPVSLATNRSCRTEHLKERIFSLT